MHLVSRSRGIAAIDGRVAALRYLSRPRERWRNWKRYV
jgi:hypothetical protein